VSSAHCDEAECVFFVDLTLKKYFCGQCLYFSTQTMRIKSFYTQQHCNVFPKILIPWQDSNPGLLVLWAAAMSTVPRCQCKQILLTYITFPNYIKVLMSFDAYVALYFMPGAGHRYHSGAGCTVTPFRQIKACLHETGIFGRTTQNERILFVPYDTNLVVRHKISV
jgi:hypothetical protein